MEVAMDELLETLGDDDWAVVARFLPPGWEDQARALGALRRCRKFAGPEPLLRTLLIHLAEGCSLRETAVRARHGGLAAVSDVALLKRLGAAGEWLRWMAQAVMTTWLLPRPPALLRPEAGVPQAGGPALRVRLVDASVVTEPGATGTTWRLHYATLLPSLRCDEIHLTSRRRGESFTRFTVAPGDLLVGDRGYAHAAGIGHVVAAGGAVLVRLNLGTCRFSTGRARPSRCSSGCAASPAPGSATGRWWSATASSGSRGGSAPSGRAVRRRRGRGPRRRARAPASATRYGRRPWRRRAG
jgi:hypothetical protein